jgi:prolyl-tRNA synthetase
VRELWTPLDERNGIEMGQVFAGDALQRKDGRISSTRRKQQPAVMGSCGSDRAALAAAIEANHDEAGIIWPRSLAPYDVHIVAIQAEKPEVREAAERLYEGLQRRGLVSYDDREETPG